MHNLPHDFYKPYEQLSVFVSLFQEPGIAGLSAAQSMWVFVCWVGCQRNRFNFCAAHLHQQNSNMLTYASASNRAKEDFFPE